MIDVDLPVHIYLPPCYQQHNPQRYPVLYLIQGANHEFGGWPALGLVETMNSYIEADKMPPFMVVMPANGDEGKQRAPYTWSSSGPNSYEGFVVDELVPFIDQNYRTQATTQQRAIGGISRGAYWAIVVAFSHPDLFGTLGVHSPSITDKLADVPPNFSMLTFAHSPEAVLALQIWVDAGDETDWASKDAQKLADDLESVGASSYQLSFGKGSHRDATWAARLGDYLFFYSGNWGEKTVAQ